MLQSVDIGLIFQLGTCILYIFANTCTAKECFMMSHLFHPPGQHFQIAPKAAYERGLSECVASTSFRNASMI